MIAYICTNKIFMEIVNTKFRIVVANLWGVEGEVDIRKGNEILEECQ